MNARYRWLSVDPLGRAQIAKIAGAMQARTYGRTVKSGYNLSTVRAEWLEGAFTERLEYVEKVSDPLGGELSISRVEFRRTEFRIGTAYPQVELRDPARQVRPLLNLIGDVLDFKVAVVPVSTPPLAWANALAKGGEPVQVVRLRSTKFSLSNEAQAAVVVTGTSDVRSLLPSLLGTRPVEAESVLCSWRTAQGEWRVELRAGGAANVVSAPVDNPGQVLRKAIAGLATA
jgi:hypothetical protein